MQTPNPQVRRHQYVQHQFAREMAIALKPVLHRLNLPPEQKGEALKRITFTALSVIDDTCVPDGEGGAVKAHLAFFPSHSKEKRIDEAVCHPHSTYLHELTPFSDKELFEFTR